MEVQKSYVRYKGPIIYPNLLICSSRKRYLLNFSGIFRRLTNIYRIKSSGISRILILDKWGLGKAFT